MMNRVKKTSLAALLIMFLAADIWGARVIDEQAPTTALPKATQNEEPVTAVKPTPQKQPVKPVAAKADAQPAGPKPTPEEERFVTMDFDEVDIKVLIKFMADVTGKNYIIGNKVAGKVTVLSPRKMTLDEANNVFLSVLAVNGYSAVPMGNITKILKTSEAMTGSIDTNVKIPATKQDQIVTQIIQLKYADANNMRTLLTPLMSKGTSQLLAYPQSNVLIATDTLSNIKKITDILRVVDVTGFAQEVQIVSLMHATATDLSAKLGMILAAEQGAAPAGRTTSRTSRSAAQVASKAESKIIPYERTNSLIILASAQDMGDIMGLISRLDIPTPSGKEDINVYYLQYANAEDLVKVLTDMPTPTAQADPKAKGAASSSKQGFKVSADADTNSLIIYADPTTYKSLVNTIKRLDIPRKQVYVKAVIMEVKANKDFKVGVEWSAFDDFVYDSGRRIGGVFARTGSNFVTNLSGVPSGPLLGVVGQGITIGDGDSAVTFPNMTSFIYAMDQDSDISVISTPQIITMDNKEAEIKVGANVPYVTREDTDSTNIDRTVRSYDYRDVGVTLKITPQINQEGNVRMDIFQEITSLVAGQGDDQFAPTTLKRSATTTVTVRDRSTMVIGGLIGETLNFGESRVPGLGDIPGLGWLFKNRTKRQEKTNLYIFLSPVVIDTDRQVDDLYREKYGEALQSRDNFFDQYNVKRKDKNDEEAEVAE